MHAENIGTASTKVAMAKVIKAFKLKPDCHCTSKYLNNLIEQDHRHIKVRKTRYQSINTAKNTLKGIECNSYNFEREFMGNQDKTKIHDIIKKIAFNKGLIDEDIQAIEDRMDDDNHISGSSE